VVRATNLHRKEIPDSNNKSRIWKKVICVGGEPARTMVVIIHDSIVKQLHIDENCWFEEIPTSEGVVLKLSRSSEPLALPRTGKEK
jgi:hypothetical protein